MWLRGRYSAAHWRALDVAVLDLDEEAAVVAEAGGEVLDDRDRAMAPAGAPDGDDEVRLALGHVLRQQVLQQRQDAPVELLEAAVAPDVLDHAAVESGERPQLGL